MGNVSEILGEKGGRVLKIEASASVFEAVQEMVEANVGSLLVTDGGDIVGIVTERDYLRRVTLEGRTDKDTAVGEIMTAPLVVVTPETEIDECMAVMTDRRIRHLPVVEDGRRGRRRLDRRPGQVQVQAAELRDPVPDRLHHCRLSRLAAAKAWGRSGPAAHGWKARTLDLRSGRCRPSRHPWRPIAASHTM